jgi:hypothetical protein
VSNHSFQHSYCIRAVSPAKLRLAQEPQDYSIAKFVCQRKFVPGLGQVQFNLLEDLDLCTKPKTLGASCPPPRNLKHTGQVSVIDNELEGPSPVPSFNLALTVEAQSRFGQRLQTCRIDAISTAFADAISPILDNP